MAIVVSHRKARFLLARQNESLELIVNDVFELNNNSSAAEALSAFLTKYKNLALEQTPTNLILTPEKYESILVERPSVDPGEIPNSLKYSLKELMTYSPERAAVDYYELPLQTSGQDKIVAVATDKTVLQSWIETLHQHKFKIVMVTAAETILRHLALESSRGVLTLYENDGAGYLVQIYQQQQLVFSRLLRSLKSVSEYSTEELEAGALEPLATEIQRSMDYYESQLRQAPVNKLVFAVEHRQPQKVMSLLSELLAVDCQLYQYPDWAQELCEGDYTDLTALAGLSELSGAEVDAE